jgi:hypothetical protein
MGDMSEVSGQVQSIEDAAYHGYQQLGGQLGAITTLLNALPLEAMLAACKRHQVTSRLTAARGTDPQQVAILAARLRNDQKVIEAYLAVQKIVAAIAKNG